MSRDSLEISENTAYCMYYGAKLEKKQYFFVYKVKNS